MKKLSIVVLIVFVLLIIFVIESGDSNGKGGSGGASSKDEDFKKQLEDFVSPMQQMGVEIRKHKRRQARLKWIETLAKETGDEYILDWVADLMEREEKLYDRKMEIQMDIQGQKMVDWAQPK